MKKNYFVQFVIIFAGLFLGLQNLSAQVICQGDQGVYKENQYWALYTTLEQSRGLGTSWTDYPYDYDRDCPGATFSYQAKKDYSSTAHARGKAYHADYEKEEKIVITEHGGYGTSGIGTSYGTWYSGSVERKVRKVSVGMNGSLSKSFRYPRVTMASYFEFHGDAKSISKTISASEATYLSTPTSTEEIVIDFSNIGNEIEVSENDPDGVFTASVSTTTGLAGKWGTVKFKASCDHSKADKIQEHEATYTLKAGSKTLTIVVKSKTKKADTQIDWQNITQIQIGNSIADIARARNAATITYLSSNENYLKVNGNTLTAIAPGKVVITAQAAATTTHNACESTKEINVVSQPLVPQTIIWPETLQQLLATALTTDDIGSEITLSVTLSPEGERTNSVVYLSGNSELAYIDPDRPNVLIISATKSGSTKITATIPSGDGFEGTSSSVDLIILDKSNDCEEYSYEQKQNEKIEPYIDMVGGGAVVPVIQIEEPSVLSFWAHRNSYFIGGNSKLTVEQQLANGSWEPVQSMNLTDGDIEYKDIKLKREATALRFSMARDAGRNNTGYITKLKVVRAKYLEYKGEPVDFGDISIDDADKQLTVPISYSNLPYQCYIKMEKGGDRFKVVAPLLLENACSTKPHGTQNVILRFSSKGLTIDDLGTVYEDNLIVTDNEGYTLLIPVCGRLMKKHQEIYWPLSSQMEVPTIFTCNTLPSTSAQNQPITYSSTKPEIAYVDENRNLVIVRDGEVEITATAPETDAYYGEEFTSTLDIRLTEITVPTVTLGSLMQGDVIAKSNITAGDVKDENENTVSGTWSFTNASQVITDAGTHTVDVQFVPIKPNFYTPDLVTQKATVQADMYNWLTFLPNHAAGYGAKSANNSYKNLLFAEDTDGNYTQLVSAGDIAITGNLYYMFMVSDVDKWRMFVPPFNVTNAYVVELIPETTDKEQMIADQKKAYSDLYTYLQEQLITNQTATADVISLVRSYIATLPNASQLGIYPIENAGGVEYYYIYKDGGEWSYDGERFHKSWEQITPSNMTMAETYAIQFPWCPMCDRDNDWHYWTGKLIILQGTPNQTLYGTTEHNAIQSNNDPASSGATLTGNYTLANVDVSDAFVFSAATNRYERAESATIAPTESFIYLNVTRQGKRAVAITRQGEIIWEDDADDSGVATDIESIDQASLRVMSQEGGFSVVSSMAQPMQVYAISGALIYQGTIAAGEAQFFAVEAGVYVVRTATHAYKVIAR